MIAWGKDKSESRVTAEFYNCAVEVMRGAEAIDEYIALPLQEAFDIEYWLLEEAKLKRMPPERDWRAQIDSVVGGGSGIGRGSQCGWPGRRARGLRGRPGCGGSAAGQVTGDLRNGRALALGAPVAASRAVAPHRATGRSNGPCQRPCDAREQVSWPTVAWISRRHRRRYLCHPIGRAHKG